MKNIKLVLAYDGRKYLGWQKTPEGPSIENTLLAALEKFFQHPVALQVAGRTDRGVHAKGQVVNFFTSKSFDLHRLKAGLNALLPEDIVILQAEQMPAGFHPTLDCIDKEYRYYVCYGPTQLPHHRFYSYHYHYALNVDDMRMASRELIGKHDYSAFCNANRDHTYVHRIREVQSIEIAEIAEDRLCIMVKGSNFLYKMVRNLAGTLLYVGNQKIRPDDISGILQSKDRTLAGMTAPAHGLFLHQVNYPGDPVT